MAVAEVAPRTAQRVVMVARFEGSVVGECGHDGGELLIEVVPMASPGLPLVVALEPTRPLNRPHAGRRTGC